MTGNLQPPLSNVQMELLKLYARGVSDETLLELKKVMAKFFLDRLRKEADQVWEEKGYSDEFFKQSNRDA
ncbi:hypothetical protein [Spirosoma panaciterrae]|uniref:hypothetical protein n=1 Tax=Spirosoma panaciterrae TaxID=496058 RepID=UPI0005932E62|nr:hypothetical protein [Spirosoma panaciterrae]